MKQLFILICCILVLGGCKRRLVPEEKKEAEVPDQQNLYIVKSGDTLSGIAKRYKATDTIEQIIKRNNITNPDKLSVGQELYILIDTTAVTNAPPSRPGRRKDG